MKLLEEQLIFRIVTHDGKNLGGEPGISYFFEDYPTALGVAIQHYPASIEAFSDTNHVTFACVGPYISAVGAPLACDNLLVPYLQKYLFGLEFLHRELVVIGSRQALQRLPKTSIATHEIDYSESWWSEIPPTNSQTPFDAVLSPMELFDRFELSDKVYGYPRLSFATHRGSFLVHPGSRAGFPERPVLYLHYFDRLTSTLAVMIGAKHFRREGTYYEYWQELGDSVLSAFNAALTYKLNVMPDIVNYHIIKESRS